MQAKHELNQDGLLTREELAAWLKVPLKTAANLSRSGKIPSLKIGRNVRYDLYAVQKALGITTEDEKGAACGEEIA